MNNRMNLNAMLAASAAANPADVLSVKHALSDLGFYEAPEWGVSEYPDRGLFDAIRQFQETSGLRVDGEMKPGGESETMLKAMAQSVRQQGRYGDTILAHITPAEANLLDRVTDGGSINPVTGLPEFNIHGVDIGFDDDDSMSDDDFWGGYESAMGAYDAQNTHGTGGFQNDSGGDNENSQLQAKGNQGQETPGGMLSTKSVPTMTVNKDEEKAKDLAERQNRAALIQLKEEEDEKETLGADPMSSIKDAPVSVNEENTTVRGGYNQPQTIEDVERENQAIMDRSDQLAAEQKSESSKPSTQQSNDVEATRSFLQDWMENLAKKAAGAPPIGSPRKGLNTTTPYNLLDGPVSLSTPPRTSARYEARFIQAT
ncbi:peptidoglycan-binding domain-containing protein [Magnetovibrio sp. PR-2]|uniref:peptidoglycan-binding domain-containing protein n=1 Tax=Magnetovibrio sp. PR-2 TaxID=3120356 RepID=UPI002FCE4E40